MTTRLLPRRIAWATAALLSTAVLLSFYVQPIGLTAGAGLVLLALLSAVRPRVALLIVAGLGPLSTTLFVVTGVGAGGLRLIEGMTLAFLAGWGAHRVVTAEPLRVPPLLRWSGGLLLVLALASAIVSGTQMLTEMGGQEQWRLLDDLFRAYAVDLTPVTFALVMAEGIALMFAVCDLCSGEAAIGESVVLMMVAGAAGAALLNIFRIVTDIAMLRDHPLRVFASTVLTHRINVHHGDLNAAGSYFALVLFLAVLAWRHSAVAGSVAIGLIGSGLWLAGSRVAFAAVALVATLTVVSRMRWRRRATMLALAAVILAAGAFAVLEPMRGQRHTAGLALASSIRMGLATGAIAMAADHPVFGVGLGRFYTLSREYVHVPLYIVQENAHNNFLQILAELGVPGLATFLTVVGAALWQCRQATGRVPTMLVAGICAFLLTCLGGHPLLVTHVSFPFWMVIGLAAAVSAGAPLRPGVRVAAAVLVAFFVLSVPVRMVSARRVADVEHTSIGFSRWQRDGDGNRFRWAGGRATFYVPVTDKSVRVPLRHSSAALGAVEVRILLDGQEANRVLLQPGEGWRVVRIVLARRPSGGFFRLDLETYVPGASEPLAIAATDTGGPIEVRRPLFDR